ncbi:branched-chain amino acid ABC transporter permease [Parazoarcus communis]|uniref:Branched-chain amino acid ABC transporter permease n=1 Tax=Parazoarcus communis TaxID=41977 RepID=A0A2U8H4H2_9RHOO|nr:branched-chain amino acid ABC transporter permease [Parazoarcus communis]AWI80832.1 branched-chain amino acid ABC transporter permease [Parazoarcus communis]
MDAIFLIEQLLNGVGYGLMLFMLAAGLTLVFGVMDTMNLAHGTLFMLGAYFAATIHVLTDSFALAIVLAVILTMIVGALLEVLLMRRLYQRNHLNQVVATFGVILLADDFVKWAWGAAPVMASAPEALSGPLELGGGLLYPAYRLLIVGAGVLAAVALYLIVNRTRVGMLVRAGASNRHMAEMMGVRVRTVFTLIFVIGAALAGVAGSLMGPITSVQVGMGESILIPALVVIVIGGIGSVRGSLIAALLVGVVDTAGRAFISPILREISSPTFAADVAPALSSVAMYVLMALILIFKPAGLFPARG